tara:strand:+ start:28 stop:456 length:429 start_codon:yes stop_codon:yes gene_type:complete
MENSTIVKLLLFFIILAILGFNVFSFLAKGTKKIADVATKGGESVVKTAKDGAKSAAATVEKADVALKKAVNNQKMEEETQKQLEKEDSTNGAIQKRSKAGWCSVGEDRGFRSCIEVNESDKCMSGDIFPTKDICINPTLRH